MVDIGAEMLFSLVFFLRYGIPEDSEGQMERCRPSETKGAVRT